MKKNLLGAVLLCLALAGCGSVNNRNDMADETQSAILSSDENGEELPVYSEADDRAAAEYLKEQYGILTDGKVPKVILDSDMAYFGDDAMCLCILVEADQLGLIDLLGVAITGGNSFVSVGTNAALTQLEYFGREDIPVYMGTDVPLFGFRDLEEQEQTVGSIDRWGAMWHLDSYISPENYHVKRDNISYNISLPIRRAIFLQVLKKPYSAGFPAHSPFLSFGIKARIFAGTFQS